jgi:hypothetical protein
MAFDQEDIAPVSCLEASSLVPTNAHHPPSPVSPVGGGEGVKLKKPPPITPNSFKRFFTPRLSSAGGMKASAARQALRDITARANNHLNSDGSSRRNLSPFADTRTSAEGTDISYAEGSAGKRKALLSPDTSPDRLCGGKRPKARHPIIVDEADARGKPKQEAISEVEGEEKEPVILIRRSCLTSVNARLFQRSLGSPGAFGGPMVQHHCTGMWMPTFYTEVLAKH